MNQFDWGLVVKTDLKNVDENGNRKPVAPGTYDAYVSSVEQQRASKGDSKSLAIAITYTIKGGDYDKRDVVEKLWIQKKDGNPNPTALEKLKVRLMQAGLTSDQINNFKGPEEEKGIGDFKLMLEAKVRITTGLDEYKEGPGAGRKFASVERVYRRA